MKIDIFSTDKKYNVIYADPPWRFVTFSDKGKGRSAERHYATMPRDELRTLPIQNIRAENCVLFLWATAPCFIEAFSLIRAWGFTYKTVAFTWVKWCKKSEKPFMGLGYYTRANAEFCLIATRGKILPRASKGVSSVILSHIEEHSKKPHEARERIV